jgi:hypothetical protein
VALVLSHNVKYSVRDNNSGTGLSDTEDAKEQTESLDYGIVFGAGVKLVTPVLPLSIEVRYHLGLANLSKTDPGNPVAEEDTVKTSALVIFIGTGF